MDPEVADILARNRAAWDRRQSWQAPARALPSLKDVRRLVQGGTPQPPQGPRGRDLYWFYDADGALLYIGISVNTAARIGQHAGSSWWHTVSRVQVDHLGVVTRREAEHVERAAIREHRPRFNIAYNDSRIR